MGEGLVLLGPSPLGVPDRPCGAGWLLSFNPWGNWASEVQRSRILVVFQVLSLTSCSSAHESFSLSLSASVCKFSKSRGQGRGLQKGKEVVVPNL